MKSYEKPIIIEEKVEIEDIIAASAQFGANVLGDVEGNWPWKK